MPRKCKFGIFVGDSCLRNESFRKIVYMLGFERIPLRTARLYRDLICKHYRLERIPLQYHSKLDGKLNGFYDYLNGEIVLNYWGETAKTCLHELSHYVTHIMDGSLKHDKYFANRYQEVINLYKKSLT